VQQRARRDQHVVPAGGALDGFIINKFECGEIASPIGKSGRSALASTEEQDSCRYRDAAQHKDMNDPPGHRHSFVYPSRYEPASYSSRHSQLHTPLGQTGSAALRRTHVFDFP